MSFILGNRDVLSAFETVSETGRVSHAYLIEGNIGSGRLTLARAIAATLICEKKTPCYSCPACRRIMEGVHQDVRELRCEEGSSSIKIEEIRELIAEAYIRPAECDRKIFIIENAQQMGAAAQNALLQIFEEPPKNVIFFLLVTNRNLLLSTLKSRAVTVKTEKFSNEFIKKELLERYPDSAELADEAALVSDGALGQAIAFMEDDKGRQAITLVKRYFSLLDKEATFASLSTVLSPAAITDKDVLFSVMRYFSPAIRDILTYSSGYTEKTVFFVDRDLLSALAQRLDKRKLIEVHDTVCRIIRDAAKVNVPMALSSINMLFSDDFS